MRNLNLTVILMCV